MVSTAEAELIRRKRICKSRARQERLGSYTAKPLLRAALLKVAADNISSIIYNIIPYHR
jgi:hypothetical protein